MLLNFKKTVLAVCLSGFVGLAFAADENPASGKPTPAQQPGDASVVKEYGDKGYWFYKEDGKTPLERLRDKQLKKQAEKKKKEKPKVVLKKEKKKLDCDNGWQPGCGFVVPKTWEEQERMRDHLMHQAYMNPEDAWAVEQWQRYLRWIVKQSIRMVSTWKFNQLNNPELDARLNRPISTMGLSLAAGMREESEKELWSLMKTMNARMFVVTKQSCEWCHKQMQNMYLFDKYIGLPVTEVSIEGECVNTRGYECVKGDLALKAAAILKADVVPSMYLYFPKDIWIKVAHGFVSLHSLKESMKNYFFAWRAAALRGLSKAAANGKTKGIVTTPTGVKLDLGQTGWGTRSPDEEKALVEALKAQLEEERKKESKKGEKE